MSEIQTEIKVEKVEKVEEKKVTFMQRAKSAAAIIVDGLERAAFSAVCVVVAGLISFMIYNERLLQESVAANSLLRKEKELLMEQVQAMQNQIKELQTPWYTKASDKAKTWWKKDS